MVILIRSDRQGNIVSVLKMHSRASETNYPFGLLGVGETILEIEATDALEALAAHELVERYTVDVKKRQLKKRAKPGRKG